MLERFADRDVLQRAFTRVEAKERERDSAELTCEGGPTLASLGHEVPRLLRRLGTLVGSGRYEFAPVVPRRVLIGERARVLFHAPPLDVVVMTAAADVLSGLLDGQLSERVFSYRRGRSSKRALLELAAFVRQHRAARPDPKTRGLYVVRRDVKAYGDSIPSGPDARLWTLLRDALQRAGIAHSTQAFDWLRGAIRPPVAPSPLGDFPADRGTPTGSPLQPLVNNLYLRTLDEELAGRAGFYARFGDDLLFAHPDAEQAREAAQHMDTQLAAHGLALSLPKCAAFYLTAAGRPSELAPDFHACTSFTYLGMRVDGRGQVGLGVEKSTRFLRDVERRLARARDLSRDIETATRVRMLCEIANAAWDPSHPTRERAADLLRHVVTDRAQLADLDHQLALRVAQASTGKRGVRSLRALSPAQLREHGLASLVRARNRHDGEDT